MHGFATDTADLAYSTSSAVIIAATSDAAFARAERTIEAASFRAGASLGLKEARERIELQPHAAAIWIEVDKDPGHELDELVGFVARQAEAGGFPTVVSATAELIDPIIARLDSAEVEVIVDASHSERLAALALASAKRGMPLRISDISNDQNAERLRQLSEEVNRIAARLVQLSAAPPLRLVPSEVPPGDDLPEVHIETIRSVIRARRLRGRYFSDDLFADPAWDMMLDLFQAEIAQLRVPVSSLCIAAAVPATTALRWIKKLVEEGLFVRQPDRHDGRRIFVELAPPVSLALRRYFTEVQGQTII